MSGVKEKLNRLRWNIWDTISVTTGLTSAAFFSSTGGKTRQASNLTQQAKLAGSNRMLVQALRIVVHPLNAAGTAVIVADMWELLKGLCTFEIDGSTLWEGHLYDLPAAMGIDGIVTRADAAATTTIHALHNGFPSALNVAILDPPLVIDAGESFQLNASWDGGCTQAATNVVTAYMAGIYDRTPR